MYMHVGIHRIALAEYSQMSTHLLGLQSFSRFLHHFVLAKLATSSIRVNSLIQGLYCEKEIANKPGLKKSLKLQLFLEERQQCIQITILNITYFGNCISASDPMSHVGVVK